jgi:hypothetical protein
VDGSRLTGPPPQAIPEAAVPCGVQSAQNSAVAASMSQLNGWTVASLAQSPFMLTASECLPSRVDIA